MPKPNIVIYANTGKRPGQEGTIRGAGGLVGYHLLASSSEALTMNLRSAGAALAFRGKENETYVFIDTHLYR